MAQILTKATLNTIAAQLYTGATVAFYTVMPTVGETLITTLTDGFLFVREAWAKQANDSSDVKMWLAGDASITLAQLKTAGLVIITIGSRTTRYTITELLDQQQLSAGFVLRLAPQKGVAG